MKLKTLSGLLLSSATLAWALPSEINYQGRLTDANGDAVTGDVTMSLKMFDAATDGNEIYSEDIGTVTLDSNGVYSFEFGAAGQSVVDVTETIATTDGSGTSFSGTPTLTPIAGTLSVTDGTYSWNELSGNPGETTTATAFVVNGFLVGVTISDGGSGYTSPPVVTINGNGADASATAVVDAGVVTAINVDNPGSGYTAATVTVADPPAPFVVDFAGGTLGFTYDFEPASGTEIVASYESNQRSLAGALAVGSSHWLELSVDNNVQSPRERILSVPFAQHSKVSFDGQIAQSAISNITAILNDIQAGRTQTENFMRFPDGSGNVTINTIETTAEVDSRYGYTGYRIVKFNGNPQDFNFSLESLPVVFFEHDVSRGSTAPGYSDNWDVTYRYSDGTYSDAFRSTGAGFYRHVNPSPTKNVTNIIGDHGGYTGVSSNNRAFVPEERKIVVDLAKPLKFRKQFSLKLDADLPREFFYLEIILHGDDGDIIIPDLRINEIQYIENTLNVNKVTFLWRPKLPYRETPSMISGFSILGW